MEPGKKETHGEAAVPPRRVESRNLFQEKEASDFDDIDFEEKEKEAGIRNNIGTNPSLPRTKAAEAKEEKEEDLDFDDLEF